ncbi:hypothetical protein [Palleronia sp. LCG004]|nr:hypothetical protein [Palleronia sp. LCG004]WOI57918.1 hypothetical protein RVY76_15030 [Palleronia sp. LCG004]
MKNPPQTTGPQEDGRWRVAVCTEEAEAPNRKQQQGDHIQPRQKVE